MGCFRLELAAIELGIVDRTNVAQGQYNRPDAKIETGRERGAELLSMRRN